MKAIRLAALGLMAMTGTARAEPPEALSGIDQIVVRKAERTLTLYSQGRAVHVIPDIQLERDLV